MDGDAPVRRPADPPARFARMPDANDTPRLGGMALANGLLVHGPTHWAAAVRNGDGEIIVASGPKPRFARGVLARVPVVRGALRMAESVAVVPVARAKTPGARLAMENARVVAAVAGSAMIASIVRRSSRSALLQESVGAVAGLLPAVATLRGSSAAATWHAVEHKSIAAYEAGGPSEVVRAAAHPKEHMRCGTNLVLPLMIFNVVVNTAIRRMAPRPTTAVRMAGSMLSVGAAVELVAFAHRRPGHPVSRAVHRVGHTIQARFATREPGPGEMVVGRAAMDEILRVEGVT